MPDYLSSAAPCPGTTAAAENGLDEDDKLEKAWLGSCIRVFIDDDRMPHAAPPKPSKHRLSTYWWCVCLDDYLRQQTTQGCEAFASPSTVPAIDALLGDECTLEFKMQMPELFKSKRFPFQWLGMPMDQCSVGMTSALGLKRLFRLYIEPLYDPAHLKCNAIWGGLRQAGQYHLIFVMKILYGINYACFGTGKWFTELLDFLKAKLRDFPEEVKILWNHLLPFIRSDLALDSVTLDDDWSAKLLAKVVEDVFESKGPKLQMSEWGSWVKATKYWDPRFHRRSFGLILLGLHRGILTGSAGKKELDIGKLTKKIDTCLVGSGKAIAEKTQQSLRIVGNNTLHCGIRLYAEGAPLQRALQVPYLLALPLHKKYQSFRTDAKSMPEALQYYRGMAGSGAIEPLKDVFKQLRDPTVLQKLRFATGPCDLPLVGVRPIVAQRIIGDEAMIAQKLGKTACCLVGRTLVSSLWSLVGLPGLLPTILDIDKAESTAVRLTLRSMDAWHTKAIEVGERLPEVQRQVDASFLGDPIPQHAMHMLRDVAFKVTPHELDRAIRGLFSVGNTVPNEQANRTARFLEEQHQENKKVSNQRLALAPMKAKVLSEKNGFAELTHKDCTAQHVKEARTSGKVATDLFVPKAKGPILPFKKLQGAKQEAPFETGTPASLNKMYAHIHWWKHCSRVEGDFDFTSRLWLSELLPIAEVVRWKVTGEVGLVVQHVDHRAALLWPVQRTVKGAYTYFEPDLQDTSDASHFVRFGFVSDIDAWEVYKIEWCGPGFALLQSFVNAALEPAGAAKKKKKAPPVIFSGIVPRLLSEQTMSVVEASARQCFLPMSANTVDALCAELGAYEGETFFDRLKFLLASILPADVDAAQLSDILGLRVEDGGDAFIDVLESEECRDAFGVDEIKQLDDYLDSMKKAARQDYKHKLHGFRTAEAKKKADAHNAKPGSAKAFRKTIKDGTREYPSVVAANELDEATALLYLPPESSVQKNTRENRWKVSWGAFTRTRTWTLYGEIPAFVLCAGFIWDQFVEAGGAKCPWDFINNGYAK